MPYLATLNSTFISQYSTIVSIHSRPTIPLRKVSAKPLPNIKTRTARKELQTTKINMIFRPSFIKRQIDEKSIDNDLIEIGNFMGVLSYE